MMAVGCSYVSPLLSGTELMFLHETCSPSSSTMNPLLQEFCMNARTPIMTPMLIRGIFNMHRHEFIIPFSLAFASFSPIRIALFGDLQQLAHANKGKFLAMLMNKLEFYGWGCAKMLTAFFTISLSCRR